MADWKSLLDKLAIPVVSIVCGTLLILSGEEQIGLLLVGAGAGIAVPQKASGILPRK